MKAEILFNSAESYRRAADILASQHRKDLISEAPIYYLFYHAAELYLKSFLRGERLTVSEIKTTLGHRFSALRDACTARGLPIADDDRDILEWIENNYIDARYIKTGTKSVVPLDRLSWTVASLAETIGGHLREKSFVIRRVMPSPF